MFFFAKSIQKAVVQPVFPPLPKLETSRGNGKTAPAAGTLYSLSGQLNRFLYKGADDFRPIVDDPALWGYSCTYFAFVGTGGEVGVRVFLGALFCFAFNMYLPFQLMPDEGEGDVGIIG